MHLSFTRLPCVLVSTCSHHQIVHVAFPNTALFNQPILGPTQLPIQWETGVQQLEYEYEHSSTSSAKKNEWSYTSIPAYPNFCDLQIITSTILAVSLHWLRSSGGWTYYIYRR